MTSLDIAKANVATLALERCLRLRRRGGFCHRLEFPAANTPFPWRSLSVIVGAPILIAVALAIAAHL
jgi:hypothetical protein